MNTEYSEKTEQNVHHQKNVSSLQKRRPSRDEDEQFASQLDSSHDAAKLRKSSSNERAYTFHTPVEFSWSQFWTAFIYETLPPVFLYPIETDWQIENHRHPNFVKCYPDLLTETKPYSIHALVFA